MMKSSDFKKIAKQILKKQSGLHDVQIMHPAREWHIGILIALIILVGSIAWSTTTYYKNKQIDSSDISAIQDDPVVYRDTLVERALVDLEQKKNVREAIINNVAIPEEAEEEDAANLDGVKTATSTASIEPESVEDEVADNATSTNTNN